MLKLVEGFVKSDFARREINPTMWISVFDFAQRAGLEDIQEHSYEKFFEAFDWDSLSTNVDEKQRQAREESK